MIENTQNCQVLSCKWPQYHFSMFFMMVYINSCSLLVRQVNIHWDSTQIDVNWRQFNVKMIENTKNRQFLLCKWPQYHFSMVFMMVHINTCSLLVCQMNIYWDSTHIDVNWRQFNVKMIENTQNRQFLLCKWPQYHFSMVFMMVYINICILIVCQMNIYWDTEILTSINVKITLKMIENAQNR